MKSPIDTVKGWIVDIDERGLVTIKAHYDDWRTLTKRQYKEVIVQMVDSRPLSDKQRKTCYMLLRAIAEWSGMELEPVKHEMKVKFLKEDLGVSEDMMFSLSDAPMSLVCAFQKFLISFILGWDVPCNIPLLDFVDDIGSYIYACLENKKCCICGQPCDLHHVDHVGTGRNREEIIHEGMEVLPLCRGHHSIDHTIGEQTFKEKYHIPHGVVLDKYLCEIYNLNSEEDSDGFNNSIT